MPAWGSAAAPAAHAGHQSSTVDMFEQRVTSSSGPNGLERVHATEAEPHKQIQGEHRWFPIHNHYVLQ